MKPVLGFIFGLCFALLLTTLAGENPWHILIVLSNSAFGSAYDFGIVLFYTTALIFTGLSVSIAFHCGLFNIGAEGQLTIGALVMATCGILFKDLPFPLAPIFATLMGVSASAAWGAFAGYLRAYRGSHEVIVTMMMNFIAAGIASYLVVGILKNPDSQNPESSPIGAGYLLSNFDFIHRLSPDSPVNLAFLLAIIIAGATWYFLKKTIWGYELKVVGQSEDVASVAGINAKKYKILSMALAGALAGLVGVNEILGSAGKFKLGFSPEYGFIGIAVALLARNNPLGIILSAFLFGVLQKGASDLDLETNVITRDFARILQAVIILSVVGSNFINIQEIITRIKKWIS
jgi:general nucleoside transport system permease protein